MVLATNGFVVGWAVFSCGAGVIRCPHSGHGRFRSLCNWWKALKFCGSCSSPGVSGEFMSAVWTPLINLPSPVGNHCTEIPVNSSSGAGCFLANYVAGPNLRNRGALMHLLVRGAFWRVW